jgi:hypothetical protein
VIHHVVSHWDENTNFMTIFTETRVMPEHLQATYPKLLAQFNRLTAPAAGRQKKRTRR